MKKSILFDLYGTLISTGTGSVDATQRILEKRGVEQDSKVVYAKWKEFHRQNIDELIKYNQFKLESEIFEDDLKMIYDFFNIDGNYKEDVKIMLDTLGKRKAYEDTLETLELLSKKYKIYTASTSDTEPLLQDFENNSINMDGIYTSEYLKAYKPQKEFYTQILEEVKCLPEEAIFVGDSLKDDIYGPQQIGIFSVLLDRKNKYDENNKIKPDSIIHSLYELEGVLSKI